MKNVKEITKEIKGSEWTKYLDRAYEKIKKDIKVDGFRKGSVPKDVYLKKAGIESLFMDAYNLAIDDTFASTIKESGMDIVVEPIVSIDTIDKDKLVLKYKLISKPEVKLGKYKNLGVKKESTNVTDKMVDEEIEHIRKHMAEVVEKTDGLLENGNTAVIDFEGKVDGDLLEGGSGENYQLEIGSKTFIEGFEDGLIGMKIGETRTLNLKFPKDYTENLKGKDVEFKVTLNGIKEKVLPEMNKEFFEDLGEKDINNEKEFRAHVKENLKKNKEQESDSKFVEALVSKAIESIEVDINPEIIDYEVKIMIHNFSHELSHQGLTLKQYYDFTGTTEEDMKKDLEPQAIKRLKTRYLLEELIIKENIEVDDKEAKKEAEEEAKHYGIKTEEFLDEIGGIEAMKFELKARKAVEILKDNN